MISLTTSRPLVSSLALAIAALAAAVLASPPGAAAVEPAAAEAAEAAPAIELVPLAPGVWMHTSWGMAYGTKFPSNGLVVRDGDGAVLVDTAWGDPATEALLARVERELHLPVKRAIATHFHDDRLGGIATLRAHGIPVLASGRTRELAKEHGLPLPDAIEGLAKPGDAVRLDGLEVFYPGAAHTADNVVVWIPAAGVLFGGCPVRALAATDAGNTADADLAAWPRSIAAVRDRYPTAKIVVPGHGAPGGRDLLDHTIDILSRR